MDVTAKLVREQGQAISFLFNQGFDQADTYFGKLTTVVPSNSRQQFYGFLDSQPTLREWVGPRVVQNVKSKPFSIENKKFEGTVSVSRDDFEDDNLGQYNIIAQQLGQAAAEKPDDLVAQLLLNGEAGLGYDGQEFFDLAHPVGTTTSANLFTGKPLTAANFNAVRAAMRGRQLAGGRTVRVRPNLLIVPPELEAQALEIVAAETTANGATNVNKGKSEVLVIDDLSADSPTSWYLADSTKPVKPMIYQERRAPRVVAKTSVTDDNVFSLDEYVWGVDMRGNAGYGPWYLISKVKAA